MANLTIALNEQIRRLSRREVKQNTKVVRKATSQYRRDIASLKRLIAGLARKVALLERAGGRSAAASPAVPAEGVRFRADGLRTHRAKLGLSAADYGKLVGVSGLTIYHWERGKTRPRQAALAKVVAVRGMGKREATRRLAPQGLTGAAKPAAGRRGARKGGGPTAVEFVTSLVKAGKATTTADINVAWKKAGRPGKADNTLTLVVKKGLLLRSKVEGGRGSSYAPV